MSKSNPEEEYFKRQELQKLAALRAKNEEQNVEDALRERRELHYNRCGRCGDEMEPKIFQGVESDICPSCGAVLLDPGELEELAGEDKSGVIGSVANFFSFSKS